MIVHIVQESKLGPGCSRIIETLLEEVPKNLLAEHRLGPHMH